MFLAGAVAGVLQLRIVQGMIAAKKPHQRIIRLSQPEARYIK